MVLVGSKLRAPLPASPLACEILCCWRRERIWNKASPCVMFQNHSELQQTQKSKGENLLRLVKRHGKTTRLFFFIPSHIFLSLFSHPMGSAECWERWEGGCTRRKEWGRDDKKARAHKSKQTNRIKPGLKAVRRQRTERQDYDRSSAAQRTAGWWSNTGAAGPPQHVHRGPGGQSERKNRKNRKKPKDNCFAHPFGGSCDHPSYETSTGKVKVWLQRVWLYEHPPKEKGHREGAHMTIPWSAQSQGPPQVGTRVFMYMQRWRKRVKTTERWEREGLASRKRKRMHRCLLHLCTTPGPKNLPWQSTSTPCIQWLKDSLLPKAGPVSSLTTLIFSRPFCCLI